LISEEEEGGGEFLGLGSKMRLLRVATCNLNQWAMDFDTNLRNVKESIVRAKAAGAVVRIGPELELTGYGCEDHFLEQDTTAHA
jgi:NAD+ synthase (glutamine-hydrolysing)